MADGPDHLKRKLNMARSTAFEKLRVAHELHRRQVVAEAFGEGRLSYSAVRAITRLDRPDPDVDRALVEVACSGEASILDLERVVRSYQLYADQRCPPGDEVDDRRHVKVRRMGDGTGQVTVTLNALELQEFSATFQAFVDVRCRGVEESSCGALCAQTNRGHTGCCPGISSDVGCTPGHVRAR